MINAVEIPKANVLIVDDLEAIVLLLTRRLDSAGYTSVTAMTNPV